MDEAARKKGREKRYCKRAHHDTWITGRRKHGQCVECQRLDDKNRRRHRRQTPEGNVPAQTLLGYIRRTGGDEPAVVSYANRWGVQRETVCRSLTRMRERRYLTIWAADRWCVALGTHLALLYPELYVSPEHPDTGRFRVG